MEKKLMLQDVINEVRHLATHVGEKFSVFEGAFASLGKQMGSMEGRMGSMEERMGSMEEKTGVMGTRILSIEGRMGSIEHRIRGIKEDTEELKERTARTELAVYQVEKDIEASHQEMRGIHRVIDCFDQRISRLEVNAGFPAAPDEA